MVAVWAAVWYAIWALIGAGGVLLLALDWRFFGPTGRGEMWFRRTVPAGSLLESCQSTDDPTLWALRLVGGGAVAAVARIGA